MSVAEPAEYTYLTLPPKAELRSCVGLVLAGMAMRARVGVGGLDEAIETLERFHSTERVTRFRFSMREEAVVAEVEGSLAGNAKRAEGEEDRWRLVVELVS